MGDEDRCTSDWATCRKNLPTDIVSEAKKKVEQDDKSELHEVFRKSVLPLINENQKSDVVLALKDIIANDTDIKPDTIVDKVAGLTKSEISATDTFVIEDFLAGVFLYTVTVVENTDGKTTTGMIDESYMSQFINRDSEVKFVDRLDSTPTDDSEVVDGIRIENDFTPNLQQNIYNQTIDVKGNGNVVNGFVFNLNNRG
jgi:hypothetical protein